MNRSINFLKKLGLPFALTFLSINVCFLTWYIFIGYQAGFHSDSAAKVLLAREIFDTGQYFPRDWNYVNGDLFVIFGHLFIIPLLALMPAGFTAHAVSGSISAGLILSGIWFLTGVTDAGIVRRFFIVAIVAAGISDFMAENLYGQVSYGTVTYLTCYIIFFSYQFIKTTGVRKTNYGIALFLTLILVFWANPQRAIVSYGLPLVVAVAWYWSKIDTAKANRDNNPFFLIIFIIFSSLAIGTVLHEMTIAGVNNTQGAGHARWLPFDLIIRNITLTLKGYLSIFGGLPPVEGVVVSNTGIYEAGRLVAAIALLVLMPIMLMKALQKRQSGDLFLGIFVLIQFAAVLFLQLTTTVPDMSNPIQSSRYFVPALLLLMIVVLTQRIDWKNSSITGAATVLVAAFFVTSPYFAFVKPGSDSPYSWGMPGQHRSFFREISNFLVKNGLHYGYSSYWNSGVLSVVSDEKLLVRQVSIDRGLPIPMKHLSSDGWYRAGAWQGESFLLLTEEESGLLDWAQIYSYAGKPVRELSYENVRIFVFNSNIAKSLPAWDTRYESPFRFIAANQSLRQIGRFVENYDNNGPALVAEQGEIGALHYGPYVILESGRYTVSFDVVAERASTGSVRLDVAAAPDQTLFAEKLLLSSNGPQKMVITLDKPQTMEFRVWATGTGRVVFKGFSIMRTSLSELRE
jgi:hypothetical protein